MNRIGLTLLVGICSFFLVMGSASAAGFSDVTQKQWFYQDVMKLTEQGIIAGFEDGTFRPYQEVTRAQAAILIHGALGAKNTTTFTPEMTDVPSGHWAYDEISVLIELGILDNAEMFNPNRNLTRAELSRILVDGFDLTETSSKQFDDVPKTAWYASYVNKLYAAGITVGKTETQFDPQGNVTRAEIAAFVARTLAYKNPPAYDFSMFSVAYQKEAALKSMERVKLERSKAGVQTIVWDPEMARFAQWKAEDMANKGYFSHTTPEGRTFGEQLKDFNISYGSASENIAYTYSTDTTQVYNLWMDSPGHKANILKRYTNTRGQEVTAGFGAGIAKASDGKYYWVNVFRDAR